MRPTFSHVSAPYYFCISSNKQLRTVLHLTKAEEIWAFYFGPLGDLFTEFCFNFFLGFAPGPLGNCEDVNECVEYGHQCAFRCHNIPGILICVSYPFIHRDYKTILN